MTETIRVTCLLDRYWNTTEKTYRGTEKNGTLIDVSMQSSEENADKLIPAGIVVLDDGTFQSVPMDFIKKLTSEL